MRKPQYLRFRRIIKITQGLLIIVLLFLTVIIKLRSL